MWYPRLAVVPGVHYSGPAVDRARLTLRTMEPRVETYDFDGQRRQSLWWGDGSASPASQRMETDLKEVATHGVLRSMAEALELPGEPTDYHFIIQRVGEELWRRRRQEPEVLMDIERVFWLDIRLIEACPQAVTNEYSDETPFFEVRAFRWLALLYLGEGALVEAIDVAQRAVRFNQQHQLLEELVGRLAVIAAEEGSSLGAL